MNSSDKITDLLKSSSFQSLVQEADTCEDAMNLLEVINISLESYIFFIEQGIDFRANREAAGLLNIFKQLDTIYNEN